MVEHGPEEPGVGSSNLPSSANIDVMKIVAISDIHGYLPNDLPEGDILCICGDIVPLDYQSNTFKSISWFLLDFLPWTDGLCFKKVIFIAGNHDFFLQTATKQLVEHYQLPGELLKVLLPDNHRSKHKLIYLHDSKVVIDNIVFYGTPWIPDLQNWAFYKSHEDLVKVFSQMPKHIDVLMSHTPPKLNDCGKVLQACYSMGKDFGCTELRDAILERDVRWSISGHVHSGNHSVTEYNNTKFSNVSLKDEDYHIWYSPLVFTI